MDKLLPCPLCGGEARQHNRVNANTVTCQSCGLMVKQSGPGEGDAAKKWNTRHAPEGWQPIVTAPTGTMILLADMHAREARHWAFVGWRHSGSADGCVTTTERVQQPATHWTPLPAAPKWGGE